MNDATHLLVGCFAMQTSDELTLCLSKGFACLAFLCCFLGCFWCFLHGLLLLIGEYYVGEGIAAGVFQDHRLDTSRIVAVVYGVCSSAFCGFQRAAPRKP